LPDHSSLTRIRERFGLEVFRRFFERIVEECFEAGLVWGEEIFFDATKKVEANASMESRMPRLAAQAHLDELFGGEEIPQTVEGEATPRGLPRGPIWASSTHGRGSRASGEGERSKGRLGLEINGKPDRAIVRHGYPGGGAIIRGLSLTDPEDAALMQTTRGAPHLWATTPTTTSWT
jgi:hypothetical protein